MTDQNPDHPKLPKPTARLAAGPREDTVNADRDERALKPAERRAVEQTAGALTGTYEPEELATLREDWPA